MAQHLTEDEFISTDQCVGYLKLLGAFILTSKEYRKAASGEIYSEIVYRHCAALREDEFYNTLLPSKSIYRARKAVEALHDRMDILITYGPHILAHNATPNPTPESFHEAYMLRSKQSVLQRMREKANERISVGASTRNTRFIFHHLVRLGFSNARRIPCAVLPRGPWRPIRLGSAQHVSRNIRKACE